MDKNLRKTAIEHAKHNILDFMYNGKKYMIYPTRQTFKPWKIHSFCLACFDDYGTAGPLPNAEPAFSKKIICG